MGFSVDWLALREPADRAARDPALLRKAAAIAGPAPVIVDLGCGTGSTWRAMSPVLPDHATWRFVDHDPLLLAELSSATKGAAEVIEADLNALASVPFDGATLVTASALLDLVSEDWVRQLAARGIAFYGALNYTGKMHWTPADPEDDAVTQAFNAHQRGDKGFGPALGPTAAERSVTLFRAAEFEVHVADSPWQLGPRDAQLHKNLIAGIAQAAAEAGCDDAAGWGERRVASVAQSTGYIGHTDILAIPKRAAASVDHDG